MPNGGRFKVLRYWITILHYYSLILIPIMYTCCPQCDTRFWVTDQQLDEDNGYLHCSHCYTTFNAMLSLTQTLPEHVKQADIMGITTPNRPEPHDEDMNLDYQPLTEPLESNFQPQQPPASHSPWGVIGILILIVLFMGQYTYFMRNELARHIQLRPSLEKLCVLAKCELPLMRHPEKIEIIRRSILSHPQVKKALSINATIINKASFTQAFPVLNLKFSDLGGTIVAQRSFKARDYLPDDIDIKEGIPPDTPVRISLEIIDPGAKAINYEFSFE